MFVLCYQEEGEDLPAWMLQQAEDESEQLMQDEEVRHHLKYPCGVIVCISQMVHSYILLKFNNATLRIVAPTTNDYFDLNVATYKKVWNDFENGTL